MKRYYVAIESADLTHLDNLEGAKEMAAEMAATADGPVAVLEVVAHCVADIKWDEVEK